jgi:hypothetical protein
MPLSDHALKNPRLQKMRWKGIPKSSEWSAASQSSSRLAVFDRRNSPEIKAIDRAVAEYEAVINRPGVKLEEESEALITLYEAIEVYLATPRRHPKQRLQAVHDLRTITLFTLSDIRWQKYKDVTGGAQARHEADGPACVVREAFARPCTRGTRRELHTRSRSLAPGRTGRRGEVPVPVPAQGSKGPR